jgi:hypothetical protein
MNFPKSNSSRMLDANPCFDQLHHFLTQEIGLLAEPEHSGTWRTYFLFLK